MPNIYKHLVSSKKTHKKVDFFIIGAQKCGTSALFEILSQNKSLSPSKSKEIHYFDNDEWFLKKESLIEYNQNFNNLNSVNLLHFEASPLYLFHPQVPKRIFEYNPEAKFIVLLRNPTYRALSAWSMYHHDINLKNLHPHLHDLRSFSDSINMEFSNGLLIDFYDNPISYIKRGIYNYQLKRWFNYFNKDQFLILENHQLKNNFNDCMDSIDNFLDISNFSYFNLSANIGKKIDNEVYKKTLIKLNNFYKSHNDKLKLLIGDNINFKIDSWNSIF